MASSRLLVTLQHISLNLPKSNKQGWEMTNFFSIIFFPCIFFNEYFFPWFFTHKKITQKWTKSYLIHENRHGKMGKNDVAYFLSIKVSFLRERRKEKMWKRLDLQITKALFYIPSDLNSIMFYICFMTLRVMTKHWF